MGDATPGGKKRAAADFSTVRGNKQKRVEKDPAYSDGVKNYLSNAEYGNCKYNKLNVRIDDITEPALDDPQAFADALEDKLQVGSVQYLEPKDASGTSLAKPGLIIADIYSEVGLDEAKEAFEGFFSRVKLAKTGGHWTVREQRLVIGTSGDKIKLRGPSKMLYRHLLAVKNDAGDTGKWDADEQAWVLAFADEQDRNGICRDLCALARLVGFHLREEWCKGYKHRASALDLQNLTPARTPRLHAQRTGGLAGGNADTGAKNQSRGSAEGTTARISAEKTQHSQPLLLKICRVMHVCERQNRGATHVHGMCWAGQTASFMTMTIGP